MTRPKVDTPQAAADFIEAEMRSGFLHSGVVAPESPAGEALRTLIAAGRSAVSRETVTDALHEYLGTEVYICDRDASAWGHGTMSLDDFRLARDDDEFMASMVGLLTDTTKED